MRKATGSYRTYSSLVKLKILFLRLRWKTCLWTELQPCCPWGEHTDYDDDDINQRRNSSQLVEAINFRTTRHVCNITALCMVIKY